MLYKGQNTNEISFPLGGIGTGCIGLAGNGRLIDWEIFNKPNKGIFNGMSHFAIKAENDSEVIDARVMHGDLHGPYMGKYTTEEFTGYGFGPDRNNLTGVPHFKETEFLGEFPLAELRFIDDTFPANVSLKAFNPFIPINDKDSTIPAAFFETNITNTTDKMLTYTVCMSLNNPLKIGDARNKFCKLGDFNAISLFNEKSDSKAIDYGELTVATDELNVSYQEYWYRGGWFDSLELFWRDFTSFGEFKNRSYDYDEKYTSPNSDVCCLAAQIKLAPNESKSVKFIVSWNFPNNHRYWIDKFDPPRGEDYVPQTWKNYYAILFENSNASATYGLANWNRLYSETRLFKDALFASAMPNEAIDAVSANLAILKSATVLRLENGEFYGWEGCHCHSGSCEGSCTHVWNYAYALPFLFPKLERSMRDLDYAYNLRDDGGMPFRLHLPLGSPQWPFRPCVDGQFGNVIKVYRDWKISGDNAWLKSIWPQMKKSIDFAWSSENPDAWDRNKDGILEGMQHHTLDMELFGPNSWLNGMYLAALKAAAEMAHFLGEAQVAAEYTRIFDSGKAYVDDELFNGEYYFHKIDIKDKSILEQFEGEQSMLNKSTVESYWNDEAEEIKYQIGEGCSIDQVLAQWHANISGLGEIFDKEKTKKALQSIYKFNHKPTMRKFFNPCRIYALNDEAGTVICTWPDGKYKPVVPVPYNGESMNGFEYQVGIHMIQEGLLKEGMEVVAAIRHRFDGSKRNPWNEFECGSNYARSMASYALLNAFSGFSFDMVAGIIGFEPINDGSFFFSLESGWGQLSKEGNCYKVAVLYGSLNLKGVRLSSTNANESVKLGDKPVNFVTDEHTIRFDEVHIEAGDILQIVYN